MASEVPHIHSHLALLHPFVVEADCWYGILIEAPCRECAHESGLSSVLEADYTDFNFSVPEFGFDPGDKFVEVPRHYS